MSRHALNIEGMSHSDFGKYRYPILEKSGFFLHFIKTRFISSFAYENIMKKSCYFYTNFNPIYFLKCFLV